jgi:N-acetylglucosamine kinase-like BadF-type ATPase
MVGNLYLAIDGGGTKTDVICADENGQVVGTGQSGPTNLTSTNVGAASFNLLEAIRQAIENLPEEKRFSRLVMGLAGMDTPQEEQVARKVFQDALSYYQIDDFVLINDSLIALANGSDSPDAVVLISGTGTIAFGHNQAGETARASGMDYLLSDQGSGYYIGRQVLREAVKSYDGRAPKSILEELVCRHYNIANLSELKNHVYNPALTKIEVAELSYICSEAFAQGDAAAKTIFDHAVEELSLQLMSVIDRLQLVDKTFDCVLAGSVLHIEHVQQQLLARVREKYQNMQVRFPDQPPVYGALKLAMRGGTISP